MIFGFKLYWFWQDQWKHTALNMFQLELKELQNTFVNKFLKTNDFEIGK